MIPSPPDAPALPPVIDALAFAQRGESLAGVTPVARLERLAGELARTTGVIEWCVSGQAWRDDQGRDRPRLRLVAGGELVAVCARCLGELAHKLQIDRCLALAPDEASAEREDLETDAYDVVAASERFSVSAWLEDECLLALSVDDRHPDCSLPPVRLEESLNPFAALAPLKNKG